MGIEAGGLSGLIWLSIITRAIIQVAQSAAPGIAKLLGLLPGSRPGRRLVLNRCLEVYQGADIHEEYYQEVVPTPGVEPSALFAAPSP